MNPLFSVGYLPGEKELRTSGQQVLDFVSAVDPAQGIMRGMAASGRAFDPELSVEERKAAGIEAALETLAPMGMGVIGALAKQPAKAVLMDMLTLTGAPSDVSTSRNFSKPEAPLTSEAKAMVESGAFPKPDELQRVARENNILAGQGTGRMPVEVYGELQRRYSDEVGEIPIRGSQLPPVVFRQSPDYIYGGGAIADFKIDPELPFQKRHTGEDQVLDMIESGYVRVKPTGANSGGNNPQTIYFGGNKADSPETATQTSGGFGLGSVTSSNTNKKKNIALIADSAELHKYIGKPLPISSLKHAWKTLESGELVDILPDILKANQNLNFADGGRVASRFTGLGSMGYML